MALCRVGAISNLQNPTPFTRLPWKPCLLLKKPFSFRFQSRFQLHNHASFSFMFVAESLENGPNVLDANIKSQGTFIYVQFPKAYVEKYSSIFKEGQLYDIENFVVQSSRMKFRTCDHKYMIKANHETSVQCSMLNDSDEIDFPKQMFNLKDFASLKMSGGVVESHLFDLIGRVVTITQSKIIQVNGNPSRLIDFVIEDARESRLMVTMWDEHVECVLPYYNVDLEDPLIIIIQLCRARVDQYTEVRISSSYSATKLLFNYECPEILNFKESLPRFFSPIRSISSRSRLSGSGTMNGETYENITIILLKEIYDKKEAREFWVVGEIVGIEGGGEWCFIACKGKSCGKKL